MSEVKPQNVQTKAPKRRSRTAEQAERRRHKRNEEFETLANEPWVGFRKKEDYRKRREWLQKRHKYWSQNKPWINEKRRAKRNELIYIGYAPTKKDKNLIHFIVTNRENTRFIVYTKRRCVSKGGREAMRLVCKEEFSEKDEAIAYIESFSEDMVNARSMRIDDYYAIVMRLMDDIDEVKKLDPRQQRMRSFPYVPKNLAFLFAVRCYREQIRGIKNHENRKRIRMAVLRAVGNQHLPSGYFLRHEALDMLEKIAKNVESKNGTQAKTTYRRKVRELTLAFDLISEMPLVFRGMRGLQGFSTTLRDLQQVVRDENLFDSQTGIGALVNDESYEPLAIQGVEDLLRAMATYDIALFNYFVLGLSTCLRVTELGTLVNGGYREPCGDKETKFRKDDFIIDGVYLNYHSGNLVTKTSARVNPKLLVNPLISFVTYLILAREFPIRVPQNRELQKSATKSIQCRFENLSEFYARRIRCTGATMLRFCEEEETTPFRKSSIAEVKERCGHKDTSMVQQIYARNRPSQNLKPSDYFNVREPIGSDGMDFRVSSTYWDAYLLKLWLVANAGCLPAALQSEFRNRVVLHWVNYQAIVEGQRAA